MTKYLWMAVVVLAGCGGGNSFSGKVAGYSFSPKEAVYVTGTTADGTRFLGVALSDVTGICAAYSNHQALRNATVFSFSLSAYDAQQRSVPPVTGDYSLSNPNGNVAGAVFDRVDSNCNSVFNGNAPVANAGQISLTGLSSSSNGSASGHYDIQFSSDRVTGTFSAQYCAAFDQVYSGNLNCY